MATPLDTGLLQTIGFIFPLILIMSVVYGVLVFTKAFGDNKNIPFIIAFALGVMVMFSSVAREIIETMAPWFVVFMFFLIFLLIMIKIFGATNDDIVGVLKSSKYSYIVVWIVAIALIIGFGSLTSVLSKHGGVGKTNETSLAEPVEGGQQTAFWNTLTHPKVLGSIFILLIASFTISSLGKKE